MFFTFSQHTKAWFSFGLPSKIVLDWSDLPLLNPRGCQGTPPVPTALPSLPRDLLPTVTWDRPCPGIPGILLSSRFLLHPGRASGERRGNHCTVLRKKMLIKAEGPINLLPSLPLRQAQHKSRGFHSAEAQLVLHLQFNLHQVAVGVSPEDVPIVTSKRAAKLQGQLALLF